MHLHCSGSLVLSMSGIICSKVCVAVNPGRHHPRWMICWWRHERSKYCRRWNACECSWDWGRLLGKVPMMGQQCWPDAAPPGMLWSRYRWCSWACVERGKAKATRLLSLPDTKLEWMHPDGGFPKRLTCWRSKSVHLGSRRTPLREPQGCQA